MSPKNGWRTWWKSTRVLRFYFRQAEYPMGPVRASYEAVKMAWRWP